MNSAKFERVLTFAKDWVCDENTVLKCFKAFTSDLILEGLLPEKNGRVVDLWIQDLKAVGYQDIPLASEKEAAGPCIGDNALEGVYFHPHAVEEKKQSGAIHKTVFFTIQSRDHPNSTYSPLPNSAP